MTVNWEFPTMRGEVLSLRRRALFVWRKLVDQVFDSRGRVDHPDLSKSHIVTCFLLLNLGHILCNAFGCRGRLRERETLSPTATEDAFEACRGAEDDEDEDFPRPVAD